MIHWLWLIPAMMFGGTFSIFLMAILMANKEDDQ